MRVNKDVGERRRALVGLRGLHAKTERRSKLIGGVQQNRKPTSNSVSGFISNALNSFVTTKKIVGFIS